MNILIISSIIIYSFFILFFLYYFFKNQEIRFFFLTITMFFFLLQRYVFNEKKNILLLKKQQNDRILEITKKEELLGIIESSKFLEIDLQIIKNFIEETKLKLSSDEFLKTLSVIKSKLLSTSLTQLNKILTPPKDIFYSYLKSFFINILFFKKNQFMLNKKINFGLVTISPSEIKKSIDNYNLNKLYSLEDNIILEKGILSYTVMDKYIIIKFFDIIITLQFENGFFFTLGKTMPTIIGNSNIFIELSPNLVKKTINDDSDSFLYFLQHWDSEKLIPFYKDKDFFSSGKEFTGNSFKSISGLFENIDIIENQKKFKGSDVNFSIEPDKFILSKGNNNLVIETTRPEIINLTFNNINRDIIVPL